MSLTVFKCWKCKSLPDSHVFICRNQHIFCIMCAKESKNLCSCMCALEPKKNPLETALLNASTCCVFKPNGCTWSFSAKDLAEHVRECKYRPYNCVGHTMNVWICEWTGLKYQMPDHFKKSHNSLGDFYQHSAEGSVPFVVSNGASLVSTLNLVDAFNKHFIFYYQSNGRENEMHMIIYLLGRKQDAIKYQYELEIFCPGDKTLKIKFTQSCYSDTEGIPKLIEDGKCLSLTYKVVKNFLYADHIFFRFRLSKTDEQSNFNGRAVNIVTANCKKVPQRQIEFHTSIAKSHHGYKKPSIPLSLQEGKLMQQQEQNTNRSQSSSTKGLPIDISPKSSSINKMENQVTTPTRSPSIHKNLFLEEMQRHNNVNHILKEQLPDFNRQLMNKDNKYEAGKKNREDISKQFEKRSGM